MQASAAHRTIPAMPMRCPHDAPDGLPCPRPHRRRHAPRSPCAQHVPRDAPHEVLHELMHRVIAAIHEDKPHSLRRVVGPQSCCAAPQPRASPVQGIPGARVAVQHAVQVILEHRGVSRPVPHRDGHGAGGREDLAAPERGRGRRRRRDVLQKDHHMQRHLRGTSGTAVARRSRKR